MKKMKTKKIKTKKIKEKLMIAGIGKHNEENFIRIKARRKSFAIPHIIDMFLNDLGFHSHFSEKSFERKGKWIDTKARYKDNIGAHDFLENDKYKIHVIFGERYLYLIIKTPLRNRKEMFRKLMEYSVWIKSKKKMKIRRIRKKLK